VTKPGIQPSEMAPETRAEAEPETDDSDRPESDAHEG
jgi:hypothetical protein